MTPDHQFANINERLDVIHGCVLSLNVLAHALIATHQNKKSLKLAFETSMQASDSHATFAPYGDELLATFQMCCQQLLTQIAAPEGKIRT